MREMPVNSDLRECSVNLNNRQGVSFSMEFRRAFLSDINLERCNTLFIIVGNVTSNRYIA